MADSIIETRVLTDGVDSIEYRFTYQFENEGDTAIFHVSIFDAEDQTAAKILADVKASVLKSTWVSSTSTESVNEDSNGSVSL